MSLFVDLSIEKFVSTPPVIASEETNLKDLHDIMEKNKISHIPLVDDMGNPTGMLGERDVRTFYLSSDFPKIRARNIMNTSFLTFFPDESLKTVIQSMNKNDQCAVVIMDKKRHLLGIFTVTDALKALDHVFENYAE